MKAPESCPDDLAAVLRHAWQGVTRAVHDRSSPLRTPMLATSGLDAGPRLRTVVLRGADAVAWRVIVHTDRRSAKVAELERDPRVSLAFHDAAQGMQIRLEGVATLFGNCDVAAAAWARLPQASRRNYRTALAPGTPSPIATDGLPAGDLPYDFGIENFVLIEIAVGALEWLLLRPDGQRRARFTPETSAWLVP